MRRPGAFAFVISLLLACGGDVDSTPDQIIFGGDERPTKLRVPADYDHSVETPLIVVIHGRGLDGRIQLAYSRLEDVHALILAPDGTYGADGRSFWNATDACCDFSDTGVDDVAYIGGLIDEVSAVYNVDPTRIYLWGYSNGGFMSYRMACERSETIAGIISLAGATYLDQGDCNPSEPVNVLQIHGTVDQIVLYEGGETCIGEGCGYPGASESLKHWADYNGCEDTLSADTGGLDLNSAAPGDETKVERHDACPAGVDVELWRMEGVGHIQSFRPSVGEAFWSWFERHPKT